jgi:tetratricopeptide (TPR) repeat protein
MDMHNWHHNNWLFFSVNHLSILALAFLTFGCSSSVKAPQPNYSTTVKNTTEPVHTYLSKNNECAIDLEQEALIEKKCLDSWRKCVSGNKKEGIAELKKLSQKYPRSSSVLFMTGQVLDRYGDKKEAIAYYEKAANNSDFAAMSLFKIAESLRNTGNTEQAIDKYRKLIDISPQFTEAHLGLAKCLIKTTPDSEEAKNELKKVLELEPNNKDAQALLSQSPSQ